VEDNYDREQYYGVCFMTEAGLVLLASDDPVTIQQFRKFDAIIVDLQLREQAGLILDAARLSPSNQKAVRFAISGSDAEGTAFRKKTAFVFERPLSAKSIGNTLRPAYGLILRERRRYFRCPVAISAVILRRSKPEIRCNSVNISEGGMALSTIVPLSSGEKVHVQFTLPGHEVPFVAESTICWLKTGHIGLRFVSLSQEHKSELKGWLSRKLEEMLPEIVAGKFRRAEGCSATTPGDREQD
jgi:hypothetical protein